MAAFNYLLKKTYVTVKIFYYKSSDSDLKYTVLKVTFFQRLVRLESKIKVKTAQINQSTVAILWFYL